MAISGPVPAAINVAREKRRCKRLFKYHWLAAGLPFQDIKLQLELDIVPVHILVA